MRFLTVQRGVVFRGGDSGFSFIQESAMIGYLLTLEVNFDPVPQLMDLHLFPDEPFRHGIAIGIDLHIAFHIDRSIQRLIDRRQIRR
jgi:hypothetical protein